MLKSGLLLEKMKCLGCGSQYSEDEVHKRNVYLNKELKRWHREEDRIVKLLLLGTGESGKSTITKQMKIIHIDGFSDSERREKIPDIKRNVRDAILILTGAMTNLNIPIEDDKHRQSMEYIKSEVVREDFEESEIYYDHVTRLWQDKGVQECYHRSNEYQLFDSAKYFLDKVRQIRQEDYVPSDQDLVRCRVMTNSIQRIDFVAMDARSEVKFSVYDVGGQQGERRKWIQVFDMVTAILFVVDCSCFDQTLREDSNKNRFLEAMEIFEQVWNNKFLGDVPVMLFLNKIDILEDKILEGRSLNMLVDSMDQSHPYYSMLAEFRNFTKIKESEKREFIEAFPRRHISSSSTASSTTSTSEEFDNLKVLRAGRKKSSVAMLYRDDINEEVIRTAVFVKRIFMKLVQSPVTYRRASHWHERHSCEYYFTCAVDTQTIKKVLEGCRCFIIRKVIGKFGV